MLACQEVGIGRNVVMSKHTSIMLSDEATEVVDNYAQTHKCSRNKAINDLIVANNKNEVQILKYLKAIYNKVK